MISLGKLRDNIIKWEYDSKGVISYFGKVIK